MKRALLLLSLPLAVLSVSSCKKSTSVSQAQIQVGQPIDATKPLCGTYKGTMLADKTYNVTCDITINAGDTLLIQKGVHVNMGKGTTIIVNGTFVSLGTQADPNFIRDSTKTKTTGSSSVGTDSAYSGGWCGIYCSPTCNLFVCKWTHLDFGGAGVQTLPFPPGASGHPAVGDEYVLFFGNQNGNFIFEDSWMYGCPDDATRFYGGHVNIMRNTIEKLGGPGGDGFNAKGGTVGNMAYNMCIGSATNGTKSANDIPISGVETSIAMYNNTYVNCGFRNTGTFGARAGSAEVENQSTGYVYNNLIVNCLTGYRIAGGNSVTAKVYHADTANSTYGYNFMYADDASLANQFVPTDIAQAECNQPQSTDIPNMKAFLPANFMDGAPIYDASSLVGKNNPMFKNYPLPNLNYKTQASIDGYDFHLQGGSPALGKGLTTIPNVPIINVPIDANFGSSGITAPGKDMGCYQSDGTGNQH